MADEIEKDGQLKFAGDNMYPRSVIAVPYTSRVKTADISSSSSPSPMFNNINLSGNVPRTPSRKFYSPEITTSSIYLPKTIRDKNRWNRWFYDHDPIVGAVLDTHAFLPHSKAEIICEDSKIKRHFESMLDELKFFSMMPIIDLEYLKIGEVFIYMYFDDTKGMWTHMILHNPDFIEVKGSPFSLDAPIVELRPDQELKKILQSTDPKEAQIRKRIPREILQKLLWGQNIPMREFNMTHLKRTSSPYDLRGTSIVTRLFRLLMYQDKLMEANITIADNHIFPLKIFKLGDPNQKWVPNETHQQALAELLQQAQMDPNFSIIYHYGLQYEIHGYEGHVMKLNAELESMDKIKMLGLGVSQALLTGETTYSSANAGLQVLLGTYKAKRDMFESEWIYPKVFRPVSELNEFYRIDKKELAGHYRVKRTAQELSERLIVPKLDWHKKLMIRDDQQYLQWLSTLYSRAQGPISTTTLLRAAGIDPEQELRNKKEEKNLEMQHGIEFVPAPAAGGPMGPLGPIASVQKFRKKFSSLFDGIRNKKAREEIKTLLEETNLRRTKTADVKEEKRLKAYATDREDFLVGTSNRIKKVKDPFQGLVDSTGKPSPAAINLNPDLPDLPVWALKLHENKVLPIKVSESLLRCEKSLLDLWDSSLKSAAPKFSQIDNLTEQFRSLSQAKTEFAEKYSDACHEIYTQGKFYSYDKTGYTDIKIKYALSLNPILPENLAMDRFVDEFSVDTSYQYMIQDLERIDLKNLKEANKFLQKSIRTGLYSCFILASLRGMEEQGISMVRVRFGAPCAECSKINEHSYDINYLLSLEDDLANFLHPDCIPALSPEINANSDQLDPNIKRTENFISDSVTLKNVPVEYFSQVKMVIERLGSLNKDILKNYTIQFEDDLTQNKVWETERMGSYDTALDSQLKNALLLKDKREFSQTQYLSKDKLLLISNNIWKAASPVEEIFVNELTPHIYSQFKNKLDSLNTSGAFGALGKDELDKLKEAEILLPLSEKDDLGWRINDKVDDFDTVLEVIKVSSVAKSLIRYGRLSNFVWNKEGKLITDVIKGNDSESIFREFFTMYILEPTKFAFLDKKMYLDFEGIIKK